MLHLAHLQEDWYLDKILEFREETSTDLKMITIILEEAELLQPQETTILRQPTEQ